MFPEPMTAGPLKFTGSVPKWIIDWGSDLNLCSSVELTSGAHGLAQDGIRRDGYGIWVVQSAERVLGGSAIRHQLEQARQLREQFVSELATAKATEKLNAQGVAELEIRTTRQKRRKELLNEIEGLPELRRSLASAATLRDSKKQERDRAREAASQAERAVFDAELSLDRKKDELEKRRGELEGSRTTVTELEARTAILEPGIEGLKSQLEKQLVDEAQAGKLPPLAIAERELERAQNALNKFEAEGEIPSETVRQERLMLQRNLEELERHVQDRQHEADCARLELEQCRGDYLDVIRSTLHDYSKRARALAEMASAKLEIELPDLRNDDRSLDEAGILVRIGFDGKPPTELGDTGHSGGQQVIAGLILLMSMAETEGDSFFIVDERFAHLSLDRVDDVGRFLRRSGAQFLITVPTTLDRGQLDPASLLIVLSKKLPAAAFAPRPIVARA